MEFIRNKKSNRITEYNYVLVKIEANSENNDEINESKSTILIEDKNLSSDKVLEPLEVLENETHKEMEKRMKHTRHIK